MNGRFTHQLLPYSGTQEFLDRAVPFVAEGAAAGDVVVAVAAEPRLQLLYDALEPTSGTGARTDIRTGTVQYIEATDWYRHPARTFAHCLHRAEEGRRRGRRLRLLGEPVWAGRSGYETREWQRAEALVNIAFGRTRAAIMCAYDTAALPGGIVESARRTHPEYAGGDRPRTNPGYRDPWSYSVRFDRPALPPPPGDARALPIDAPDLFWLRAYVSEYARRFDIPGTELHRLLVAMTEVVTNALRHGAPPITLRLWTEPGETTDDTGPPPHAELVCEVTDTGGWRPPAGHGFLPPDPAEQARLGLWAVRMLCSAVQIRADGRGTTVRLRVPAAVAA